MTDFTKDELAHIHEALSCLSFLGWEKSDKLFRDKLQSMIDSYDNNALCYCKVIKNICPKCNSCDYDVGVCLPCFQNKSICLCKEICNIEQKE